MKDAQNWIDTEGWKDAFMTTGTEVIDRASGFLPQLLAALSILAIGWLLGRLVEAATTRALRTVGLDRAAAHLHLGAVLERSEIRMSASQIIGRAVFWIILLTAFLSSVETIGLTAVTSTIDRLIAYIPNLIGAGLIALLGVLAARVLGGIVRSASIAADLQSADRLGVATQWALIGLVAIVSIEQLGVATEVLVTPLATVLGALTLSAGFAVALGARPIITHILAGHFLRRSLPNETRVMVGGEQGFVEGVGATETRLRGETKSWTVPNGRLLDGVVTWI
jgi:hypothetical protein